MCGRSSLHEEPKELLESYGLPPRLSGFRPRFNIAPSQTQWAILRDGNGLVCVRELRWGLVPSWANDPSVGAKMINARCETIAEKPSYKDALRNRRCLIIADGYYEWMKSERGKVPMRFEMLGGKAFVFAGLWERWEKGDEPLETCTIITAPAGIATAHIHDRMPVIFDHAESLRWLDDSSAKRDLLPLLRAYPGNLEMFEVSSVVNNPANHTEDCIKRIPAN